MTFQFPRIHKYIEKHITLLYYVLTVWQTVFFTCHVTCPLTNDEKWWHVTELQTLQSNTFLVLWDGMRGPPDYVWSEIKKLASTWISQSTGTPHSGFLIPFPVLPTQGKCISNQFNTVKSLTKFKEQKKRFLSSLERKIGHWTKPGLWKSSCHCM